MSIISRYKPKKAADKAPSSPKFKVGDLVSCGEWGPYIIKGIHEAWGAWEYDLTARDWFSYEIVEPESSLVLWREGIDQCVI